MYLKYSVYILLFNFFIGFGQSTEAVKLLEQAEDLISYQPAEAENIAKLTLKNASDDAIKVKSLYISAMASYVKGEYELSLNKLFEAKKLSEKSKDKDYLNKINGLTNHILNYLKLVSDEKVNPPESGVEGLILGAEDYLYKGIKALRVGRPDSAVYFADEIKKNINLSKGGYPAAINYWLLADIDFKKKNFNSSLSNYKKAIETSENIENPILFNNLYQRLAANYLVLDSLSQFQEASIKAKTFSIRAAEIENKASNDFHRQKIQEMDNQFKAKIQPYTFITIGLTFLALLLMMLRLVFYVRNKNKLDMFGRMLKYLKVQEEKKETVEVQTIKIEDQKESKEVVADTETIPEPQQRASSLLPESEKQIIEALHKFESSGKFRNKDMSLGKLASQLNTNTKYLSEVINRHKGKNFNAYINELRINYITEKIKSTPAYLNYKVSYLAEECGFSSHSTFTTVFKAIVGVSPIVFVDFVREGTQKEEISV